jgi:hypothetical protein
MPWPTQTPCPIASSSSTPCCRMLSSGEPYHPGLALTHHPAAPTLGLKSDV